MTTATFKNLQTVIHISLDAAGAISHAWKIREFVVMDGDKEVHRGTSDRENVEPADLAGALPAHADVVAQLGQKDAAHLELQGAANQALEAAQAKYTEDTAALNARIEELVAANKTLAGSLAQATAAIAERDAALAHLSAAHEDFSARNAAAIAALSAPARA